MKNQILILSIFLTTITFSISAQNDNIIPVQVKEKFSDITLTTSNGKLINLPESGRNTMLVFIRGKVTPTIWCPICHYQYLEMIEEVEKTKFTEKNEMDVYFVLPYSTDSLQPWIGAFPRSLETINRWKNPEVLNDGTKSWKAYCDEFFASNYEFDLDNYELTIPVLFDPDQKVSNGLFLYKEEWGGTKVEQNIPTIYIIDKAGKVTFKYHSQYTNDRPDAEYLMNFVEKNM
jgi:peroxiredoxin